MMYSNYKISALYRAKYLLSWWVGRLNRMPRLYLVPCTSCLRLCSKRLEQKSAHLNMETMADQPKDTLHGWQQVMKPGNLELTVQLTSSLNRLEGVFFRQLLWSEPLPGRWAGHYFFQAGGLVSTSSRTLSWSGPLLGILASLRESLSSPYYLYTLVEEGTNKSVQFQIHLEAVELTIINWT